LDLITYVGLNNRMREDHGRKLDRKTLEALRIRVVRPIQEQGVHPEEVAATLGLRRSTVYG
jgi:hypothetical protein